MNTCEFEPGAVVILKSDPSVKMTVRSVDHDQVHTLWFAGNLGILKDGKFPAAALVRVDGVVRRPRTE